MSMGGEFAAPSLKVLAINNKGGFMDSMGGEFAAPSLKARLGRLIPTSRPNVWAANLPPPH